MQSVEVLLCSKSYASLEQKDRPAHWPPADWEPLTHAAIGTYHPRVSNMDGAALSRLVADLDGFIADHKHDGGIKMWVYVIVDGEGMRRCVYTRFASLNESALLELASPSSKAKEPPKPISATEPAQAEVVKETDYASKSGLEKKSRLSH